MNFFLQLFFRVVEVRKINRKMDPDGLTYVYADVKTEETDERDEFFKEEEEKSDVPRPPRHIRREMLDVISREIEKTRQKESRRAKYGSIQRMAAEYQEKGHLWVTVSTIKNAFRRFEERSKRAPKEPDLHVEEPIDYTTDKHTIKLCKDEIVKRICKFKEGFGEDKQLPNNYTMTVIKKVCYEFKVDPKDIKYWTIVHRVKKKILKSNGKGKRSPLVDVEDIFADFIAALAEKKMNLRPNQVLNLINDAINGTEVQQHLIEWKRNNNCLKDLNDVSSLGKVGIKYLHNFYKRNPHLSNSSSPLKGAGLRRKGDDDLHAEDMGDEDDEDDMEEKEGENIKLQLPSTEPTINDSNFVPTVDPPTITIDQSYYHQAAAAAAAQQQIQSPAPSFTQSTGEAPPPTAVFAQAPIERTPAPGYPSAIDQHAATAAILQVVGQRQTQQGTTAFANAEQQQAHNPAFQVEQQAAAAAAFAAQQRVEQYANSAYHQGAEQYQNAFQQAAEQYPQVRYYH